MENLLKDLKLKNISVSLKDGDLKIRFNGAALSEEIIQQIKDNKSNIIKYLQVQNAQHLEAGITPVPQSEHYVLSSSQRRLVVLNKFDEGTIAYNLPGVYVFQGDLDRASFEKSFRTLIERHEILRTVFREDETGEVRQFIIPAEAASLDISYKDLRHLPNQDERIQKLFHLELIKPFDLATGPLLRAGLYQAADKKWIFFYVMHHIICDGWSMGILIKELLLLYNTYTRREANPLTPLPIQYKDYASWQQEQLHGGALQLHKEYWLNQMNGVVPVLELPADNPRPAIKTYSGALLTKKIPASLSRGIKSLCHDQGATLFMGLLAAVNVVLHKYTGQEDITIGTSIAGRDHVDLEEQIGFYVNALALRARFNGKHHFKELLQHIRQLTVEAYEHQMYPFDELVNELRLGRDTSRSPLFDVFIDYHDEGVSGPALSQQRLNNLDISVYGWEEEVVSKFDLTFIFVEAADELQLSIEYNTDLFRRDTITRFCTHFEALLEAILSRPETPIGQLEFITKDERRQLESFGEPAGDSIPYRSIVSLFQEQVRNAPDNIALQFNEISLTYKELDERSGRLANYLIEKYGIKKGDRVGIMLDRSEAMIISILGICKSGGAYVPIDPAYPEARKEYIIKDSGARVLITQAEYIFGLQYFDGEIFSIDIQVYNTGPTNVSPEITAEAGDLAYVIYTSGSTGQPKGCAITHGGLSNYVQWANSYYFGNEDKPVFGLFTSLSFDLTITTIFCAVTTGGSLQVYSQYLEVEEILRHSFSNDSGINSIKLTPSHISLLKNAGISAPGMLRAIVGGEQVTSEHVGILKIINPAMRVFNEYGPTEATVGCIVKELEANALVLIGKPIAGARVYILGEENTLCPVGVPGEICIGGKGLAKEYLNKPQLTAEKFTADPFRQDEKIYRSGDHARWLDNGDIEFIGRRDDQVKMQGYRIELGEIEAALKTYDAIKAAAVVARKNKEGVLELSAYIVSDESIESTDIRLHLSELIPSYMMPRHFVQLTRLPLTPNGKTDKINLPDPSEAGAETGAEYVPPANETEEKLVAIWMDVLGGVTIGVRDNFFDLGGNSLKLVRLVGLINRAFDVKLTVVQLFRYPNIRALAEFLESGATNDTEDSDNEGKMAMDIMGETLKAIR